MDRCDRSDDPAVRGARLKMVLTSPRASDIVVEIVEEKSKAMRLHREGCRDLTASRPQRMTAHDSAKQRMTARWPRSSRAKVPAGSILQRTCPKTTSERPQSGPVIPLPSKMSGRSACFPFDPGKERQVRWNRVKSVLTLQYL